MAGGFLGRMLINTRRKGQPHWPVPCPSATSGRPAFPIPGLPGWTLAQLLLECLIRGCEHLPVLHFLAFCKLQREPFWIFSSFPACGFHRLPKLGEERKSLWKQSVKCEVPLFSFTNQDIGIPFRATHFPAKL